MSAYPSLSPKTHTPFYVLYGIEIESIRSALESELKLEFLAVVGCQFDKLVGPQTMPAVSCSARSLLALAPIYTHIYIYFIQSQRAATKAAVDIPESSEKTWCGYYFWALSLDR